MRVEESAPRFPNAGAQVSECTAHGGSRIRVTTGRQYIDSVFVSFQLLRSVVARHDEAAGPLLERSRCRFVPSA
jgi:hypothetical protein